MPVVMPMCQPVCPFLCLCVSLHVRFHACVSACMSIVSVADPDPGSGIGSFRIPDPKPIFSELSDSFWVKSYIIFLKIGPNFFSLALKTKIMFNFVKFVAT